MVRGTKTEGGSRGGKGGRGGLEGVSEGEGNKNREGEKQGTLEEVKRVNRVCMKGG